MTAPQKQSKTRWALVFIATAAGFAASFNVGKIAPTLLLLRAELETTLFEMGLVVSVYSILAMLLPIPIGLLTARFGAYRMLLSALMLLGGGALLSARTTTLDFLLLTRVLEGLGYVMTAIAAPALIATVVKPADRPIALGIWAGWLPLGISLMFLLSPSVIEVGGWRGVWLLTGLFPLLWLLVVGWSFRSHAHTAAPNPATRYQRGDWKILLQPGPLLLALSFCCFALTFVVTTTFLPAAWQEINQVPVAYSARLLALTIASHALGNFLGGWLIAKGYPPARVLCGAFVLPALLGGLAFTTMPFVWQYACIVVFMFVLGIVPGAVFATAPTYAQSPRQISLLIGLVFQGAATGQVLGPVLFSQLVERAGGSWNDAFWFFAACTLLGGLLMSRIPRATQLN